MTCEYCFKTTRTGKPKRIPTKLFLYAKEAISRKGTEIRYGIVLMSRMREVKRTIREIATWRLYWGLSISTREYKERLGALVRELRFLDGQAWDGVEAGKAWKGLAELLKHLRTHVWFGKPKEEESTGVSPVLIPKHFDLTVPENTPRKIRSQVSNVLRDGRPDDNPIVMWE